MFTCFKLMLINMQHAFWHLWGNEVLINRGNHSRLADGHEPTQRDWYSHYYAIMIIIMMIIIMMNPYCWWMTAPSILIFNTAHMLACFLTRILTCIPACCDIMWHVIWACYRACFEVYLNMLSCMSMWLTCFWHFRDIIWHVIWHMFLTF